MIKDLVLAEAAWLGRAGHAAPPSRRRSTTSFLNARNTSCDLSENNGKAGLEWMLSLLDRRKLGQPIYIAHVCQLPIE